MNIFFISGAASFSTRDVWDGYVRALQNGRSQVRVVPYPLFSMLSFYSAEAVCTDIVGKALDIRNAFDAVVFLDGLFFREARQWVPLTLSVHGLLTAVIATDDPYEAVADRVYALRFTNERTLSSRDAIYLPTAAELPRYLPSAIEQDIDVCFIGTVFADRWPLMRDLALYCESRGIRFELRGHFIDPPDDLKGLNYTRVTPGTVPPEDRIDLYRRSKTILNVFREHSTAESANPRIYETAALGYSAVLTSRRKEVDELLGDLVYSFSDFGELTTQLERALGHPEERQRRIDGARSIVRSSHLYENRAGILLDALRNSAATGSSSAVFPADRNVCFIFGAPRTGSTWLLQMLSGLDPVIVWDEPRFGWLTTALAQYPEEADRPDAFFSKEYMGLWTAWIREMFLEMARSRWAAADASWILVVKDVNAAEFAPFYADFFPQSKFILLVRDPFDILDSLIDMQRPGSWNEGFWLEDQQQWTEEQKVEHLAKSISRSFRFSKSGFDRCAEDSRLRLTYEQMLSDPSETIASCANFLDIRVAPEQVDSIAERKMFGNIELPRGREFPHRYGRAGGWKDSPNFAGAVPAIAEAELGKLRKELGYG